MKTPNSAEEFVTRPVASEPTCTLSTGMPPSCRQPWSGRFCRHFAKASRCFVATCIAAWTNASANSTRLPSGQAEKSCAVSASVQPLAKRAGHCFKTTWFLASHRFCISALAIESIVCLDSNCGTAKCSDNKRCIISRTMASAEPCCAASAMDSDDTSATIAATKAPKSRGEPQRAKRFSMAVNTAGQVSSCPGRNNFAQTASVQSNKLSESFCLGPCQARSSSPTKPSSASGSQSANCMRPTLRAKSRSEAKLLIWYKSFSTRASGCFAASSDDRRSPAAARSANRDETKTLVSACNISLTCEVLVFRACTASLVRPGSMASSATTSGRNGKDHDGRSISWVSNKPATYTHSSCWPAICRKKL
mmetsp:Transcript_9555/g.18350  ORF Transcript_9555/g.18350 Transcript_9555/m.18350 type:complete len:364 (-) Transcript_9555:1704-2795(-)